MTKTMDMKLRAIEKKSDARLNDPKLIDKIDESSRKLSSINVNDLLTNVTI